MEFATENRSPISHRFDERVAWGCKETAQRVAHSCTNATHAGGCELLTGMNDHPGREGLFVVF